MNQQLELKLSRLIALLEEQEFQHYRQACFGNKNMLREMVINTVLASVMGYFMFRILDLHFRG